MTKLQEQYMKETGKIPITYDTEHYCIISPDYIKWLDEKYRKNLNAFIQEEQ